jgi:hypothetical protein
MMAAVCEDEVGVVRLLWLYGGVGYKSSVRRQIVSALALAHTPPQSLIPFIPHLIFFAHNRHHVW